MLDGRSEREEGRRMGKSRAARWLACGVLLGARSAAAITFTATDLGRAQSVGFAINASAEMVGEFRTDQGETHAFLYGGGTFADIGTPGRYSSARDINDGHVIVGGATFPGTDQHAFLYEGGIMTDLGTLADGSLQSFALAVSVSNQVAGVSQDYNLTSQAFLYGGGVLTALPPLPNGAPLSAAYGINASGQVVGEAVVAFGDHAFLFDGGVMVDLGTLPGDSESVAYDVNDTGQIVGASGAGRDHAFLYHDGVMRPLGALPGESGSVARAINGRGWIVGWARYGADSHAFLSDGTSVLDLNTLLAPGSDLLYEARDINDAGQIAANAVRGGESRAVLLTPDACCDGTLEPGELCDDGNLTSGDGCDVNCTPTGCGNGVATDGEQCDDGNRLDGDGCSATCRREPRCGDGIVDPGESCDGAAFPPGAPPGRACRPAESPLACTFCGDGRLQPGEQCDDGNGVDRDGCHNDCSAPRCGDGVLDPGETCDDGNALPGDDCNPECARPGLGVTHHSVVWNSPRTGTRPLEVEIWYPAATSGRTWDVPWGGERDVPVGPGRFPLVVFSHGFQTTEGPDVNLVYAQMLRRLALQGFVVAALDHPKDDLQNVLDNFTDRPLDVQLVLDVLLDAAGTPPLLREHLDTIRVGLLGHSFGGYTVFAAAADTQFSTRDSRVKAVAGLAPAILLSDDELGTVRAPALIVSGALDDITPPPYFHERPYAALGAPKYFVQYADGNHFVVTDGCEPSFCGARQTDRYLAAFFRAYLANDPSLEDLLQPGSEAVFGNIRFLRERGPALLPGGAAPADCTLELATQIADTPGAAAPRTLACSDGASCDRDSLPGRCEFAVQLCTNEVDRHLIGCVATDVTSVRVKGTRRNPELASLATAVAAILPAGDRRCSEPTLVTVTIPPGRSVGRRAIRTFARRSDGTRDADRFVLRCEAR
jgi:probable HAF family extracellular repeat protein/cysteine-rich repeat protein